jgi:hypothetical protein
MINIVPEWITDMIKLKYPVVYFFDYNKRGFI